MDRVRVEARGKGDAWVADGRKPRIDGRRIGGGYGDKPALIQHALLEVGEVEGSILKYRAPEAGPVLRLRRGKLGVGKRVGGVEALVANITVEVAVERIRAALGDHVDIAPQSAPQFRLATGSNHLQLLHDVQPVEDAAEARGVVVCGKAVHDEVVREVPLAADGESLTWHGGGFGKELIAGCIGRRDARHQQRDIQEVAPVQRQCADFPLQDGPGHLGARRLKDGSFS